MDTVRSGDAVASTVMVAVLLSGLLSLAVATVADRVGVCPTAVAVMGTDTVTSAPSARMSEEVQVTILPRVEQPKPLLLNDAGALVLAGILRVKFTGPDVGEVPMLFTIIGTVLVWPSVRTGDG